MNRLLKDRRGIRRKQAIVDAVLAGVQPRERGEIEKLVRELGLASSRRTARDYIANNGGYQAVAMALQAKP